MPVYARRTNLAQLVVPLLILVLVLVVLYQSHRTAQEQGPPGTYLFCFWNVENLFDDSLDGRTGPGDPEYDAWYARDPEALRLKLDHLSQALVELNFGKGPDILAVAEVESERAVELLQEALNARLADPALHYSKPVIKDPGGGRHIAPAILTRLKVDRNRTQLLRKPYRILEAHLNENGHDLVVLASHWSSRVSDKTGKGRANYGDLLYGQFKAMYLSNPKVDLLICGDFNDPPDEPSVVKHLHAVGDRDEVLRSGGQDPLLLNLSAALDPRRFGTHYYGGKWFVFDQIVVSPGLLDGAGWTVEVDSLRTVNTLTKPGDPQRRPWSFGKEKQKGERGCSDHFPVTVQLKVSGGQ
jgi:endonuclease/exonuclease/phosphatase family metal-dependent hydrolase